MFVKLFHYVMRVLKSGVAPNKIVVVKVPTKNLPWQGKFTKFAQARLVHQRVPRGSCRPETSKRPTGTQYRFTKIHGCVII